MDVKTGRLRMRWFRAFVLALALSCPLADVWAANPKMNFNIPAGTLGKTILEFSDQAQVQTMYVSSSRAVAGAKTRAVVGRFTPAEALARMLEGTGVTFEFETSLSVLLRPSRTAARTLAMEAEAVEEGPFVAAQHAFEEEPQQLITITGTFIRGLEDITAPLMIMGQKEKKQAAYGTVQDVLRAMPITFGGGASEDFSFNQNYGRGSGVNLRGLGTGATLVLVNGRRQPASGIGGDFVDVSTIPWSAVERIEVLADGSSALYGSDAVAGVVNIIMREELPGIAETQTRLGNALGGANERLLAQAFGHRWENGKFLLTYQYSQRTALAARERNYAADADKRALGGSDLRSFSSNPGNILDPITHLPAFAIPNGQDGRSLDPSELIPGVANFYNQMADKDLLPDREAHSTFYTASQELGARFNLFIEGRYNQRRISATERAFSQLLTVPASNPFFIDPFGGSSYVFVDYNFLNEFGSIHDRAITTTYTNTIGMNAKISDGWQATLSGYYGKESMHWSSPNKVDPFAINNALADPNPYTAFNPFGSGSNTNPATLDAIRYTQVERAASGIRSFSFVADGPLPSLPTGTPKLALGLDQRRESLSRHEILGRNFTTSAQYEREVVAAFAELSLPVTSRVNLSLAARHEVYSDFGDTFNPKVGIRWSPSDSVRLRGSWGTSFRAPTLVDLYDKSLDVAALFPLADPQSPSGFSLILGQQGNNPNLHEETSATWTAGIDFAPKIMPGLTWTTTYYAIHYADRIWRYQPPLSLESLLAKDEWTSLVTRNPSRADIEKICRHPMFLGSVVDCLASSPAAILDVRLRNLSATTVKGIDSELKQVLPTDLGHFTLGLAGNVLLNYQQAVTRAAPALSVAGNVLNPPKLRLRGTIGWSQYGQAQPGWHAHFSADYVSRFRDDHSRFAPRVASLATFDAQLSYRIEEHDTWLGGLELTLNAVNALNRDPPFVDQELGYDPTNAKPYGQVISLTLQKSW